MSHRTFTLANTVALLTTGGVAALAFLGEVPIWPAILCCVLCGLFLRWTSRLAQSTNEITSMASSIAQGDFSGRATALSYDEIGRLALAMNQMSERVLDQMEALRKEKVRIETVLRDMRDGVLILDPEGEVLLANQTAMRLLGVPESDSTGRHLVELARYNELLDIVRRSGETAEDSRGTVQINALTLSVMISRVREGSDRVMVLHDITETARYENLRKEFVANVSHELRTPLTFIRGYVETLREGAIQDPVKSQEFLATIEKHVIQLTNLVHDLLEISRLESKPGLIRRTSVLMRDLFDRIERSFRPAVEKGRKILEVDCPAEPVSMAIDSDLMERALGNLIDNALKYTPEGGKIRLSGRVSGDRIEVEVADSGIGIPEKEIPRIFERFYRVDRSRSRDMGGTGLGLSIVKHIVDVHGGDIAVHSRIGQGSRFTIALKKTGE